ncbi:MAG: hypothetical protein JRN32_03905 [Nitrososphaerota archaeon]|jgi:hypothetical protein|nr:hypothetical protein [Nitrososphaerota archaeon]MDG7038954.1 hypothetical protein [Nitrososphaerota archaeon]MDG7043605.1 hypothetical protein [Nitrososphaerota archaeon]MDG7045946.1 hypothetical protein [Nitrososphaerota archaeon]
MPFYKKVLIIAGGKFYHDDHLSFDGGLSNDSYHWELFLSQDIDGGG